MLKQILQYSFVMLLLNIIFSPLLHASGLPQFDISKFYQQIFWLAVLFLLTFLFVKFYVIPKISGVKFTRYNLIRNSLDKASKIKNNTQKLNNEIAIIKQEYHQECKILKDDHLKKMRLLHTNYNEQLKYQKHKKLLAFQEEKDAFLHDIELNKPNYQQRMYNILIKKLKLK